MFGLDMGFIVVVLLAVAIPVLLIRWVLGVGRRRRQLDEVIKKLGRDGEG